jgi:ubiquinone/menaquinone biosynthesis C-methylase UbiE
VNNATVFSSVAREYSNFRPGYPPELFEWLARSCLRNEAVWDCGCGSGQASVALAAHFQRVYATDASAEQIGAAKPHESVSYSVAKAERSGLPDASVDLVTVAQALHWFDVDAFYAEARRVARPGAVLAVWTYPRPEFMDPALDRVFRDFYIHVVGPYWPPERRHVDAHYGTLPPPPKEWASIELLPPPLALELQWSRQQVLGYVSSWSASVRYQKEKGTDPVPLLDDMFAAVWPGDTQAILRMPLVLRVARLAS